MTYWIINIACHNRGHLSQHKLIHEILGLIASASIHGSDKPAHPCSLARAFAAHT